MDYFIIDLLLLRVRHLLRIFAISDTAITLKVTANSLNHMEKGSGVVLNTAPAY